MKISSQRLEQQFFRTLNRLVEPAVRRGIGSPRFAPGGLILLETTGFKTGMTRRTPLLATRLGRYTLVSTFRGDRSFWVKNLIKEGRTRYFLGGKEREAHALVMAPGTPYRRPDTLPYLIGRLTDRLAELTGNGWAFVLLGPPAER